MTFLLTARAFLSRLPVWAWLIPALLAVWAIDRATYGARRFHDGSESVLVELRKAEAKAAKRSIEAIKEAGHAGVERAERFDVEQETLSEAIRKAEDANQNALDALF